MDFHRAGHEGSLHLADRIVNRGTPAFVEDLDTEDLGSAHGAVFVGTGDGHVKGKDLVAVPGSYDFLKLSGLSDLNGIELIDGGSGVELSAEIALYGRAEDGCSGCRALELGTDFVLVGYEGSFGSGVVEYMLITDSNKSPVLLLTEGAV
jgi:hypothetical protein